MPTVKEDLLKFIGDLPDDASLDDIEYFFYVRRKIEHGREAARKGEILTMKEFETRMKEWNERSTGQSQS